MLDSGWPRDFRLTVAGSPLVPRAGTATHITSFGTDNVGVAAGEYWTAALKSDGTVWVTGNNSNGALGRLQNGVGGVINTPVPLQVPNLTNVAKLFGCARTVVVLKNDGTVCAWGEVSGNLLNTPAVPTQVMGL